MDAGIGDLRVLTPTPGELKASEGATAAICSADMPTVIAGKDETAIPSLQTGQVSSSAEINPADPMDFGRHRRQNVSQKQMKIDHPKGNKRQLKKYYTRQNDLIDQFLGAEDEERASEEDDARNAPKIKFAVNASFAVNFCLFIIQLYAAIATGSLSVSRSARMNPIFCVSLTNAVSSALRHGGRCLRECFSLSTTQTCRP